MADLLGAATTLANGIMSRVTKVKINQEECKLLASLSEKTLPLLETLFRKDSSDPSVTKAIELVHEALEQADKAIEDCSKAAFFSALMHPDSYSLSLKHAAEKLGHAVSQIPLATIGMTVDMQSDISALCTELRKAQFNEHAAMAHQTIALKKELDKAFHQNVEDSDEVKKLIRELMQKHSSSNDELRSELAKLQVNASEARKAKEKQLEFELNQVIAIIFESLDDDRKSSRVTRDLKECLHCPISKEIMRYPVVLKESGMIYDRSSIEEWLKRGHHHDPLTNIELVSGDYFPCRALQDACQGLLEESRASSLVVDNPPIEESKPQMIVPGLYEGHGKLMIGSKIIHASQVLVVQPSRLVVGCCLYEIERNLAERKKLKIGKGEWENTPLQLSFGDDCYLYEGEVELGISGRHLGMKWTGTVSLVDAPHEQHDFMFVCSAPYVNHSIWARPGILQMEGDMVSPRTTSGAVGALLMSPTTVKYKSKLILALEDDTTIQGCMWFESASSESKTTGHIAGGSWNSDGSLSFKVEFSQTIPTGQRTIQKEILLALKFQDGRVDVPAFIARVIKVTNYEASAFDQSSDVPLEGVKLLEYTYVREATNSWYRFVPSPRNMFQVSEDYELESGEYCIRAYLDSGDGLVPSHMHVADDSSDFIALPSMHVSWHNSRMLDKPYWVRAAIWKLERTLPNGGYKVSLSENHRNVEEAKDHVGKIMDVWRHQDPKKTRSGCYLCVSEASRIEYQCAWTLKRRHDRRFHLALETARNPKITGGADYFVSHPVPEHDTRNVSSQYASLTRNPGDALRIILESPYQQ